MTHQNLPRHHWLIRYYRAQLRFQLHVFAALRILPPPIAAAVFAWLRRTEVPKRGSTVNQTLRSKIVVPIVILLGVTALILTLVVRWHDASARPSGTPDSAGTVVPGETGQTPVRLEAWKRPTTTDPKLFAVAYAQAIWTYDTTRHGLADWQDAVSVFADPNGAAPQVAKSLLPLWGQWNQLDLHKASATVTDITAETTPQLAALEHKPGTPEGWKGFVIRGRQMTILDTGSTVVARQAAVAVVCAPICTFWSATPQVGP
jgi:hypothetical protein